VTDVKLLRPNGDWVGDANKHRIGITPDKIVSNAPGVQFLSAEDEQLKTGLGILRSKMH
jgi:hypothetical protein